ncbi:uncharacterized protein EV422DRAFT_509429, partial [Fimicolochytrium jonesii]|uniref:uncharacterized protein n=1 Tax=Fimicolochytrium jonesii TaxID=1396493 RepID=UPI0022FF093F
IWRAELDAVVKEGRKKAEIVECLKEEAHEYILQSRAQQWDGMPYGIGTQFVPHLPAGLETLLRNYRSEGAPFFATILETYLFLHAWTWSASLSCKTFWRRPDLGTDTTGTTIPHVDIIARPGGTSYPDHIMKRFNKHVTTSGFGAHLRKEAWLSIAGMPEHDGVFGTWWYKRDNQCDADAKTGFCKQVADILEATGYAKEAEFCNVLREFFEALDLSGISQDDREGRVDRMIDWLADKVLPFMYGEPCLLHLPQTPYAYRHSRLTCPPALLHDEETALPIELLEATLILCFGRRAMIRFLESVPCNKTYAETSPDPEKCTPVFNDCWRQSNDVENHFSAFNQILGKGGRGQVNKASPTDAFLALKKLLIVHKMQND